MHENALGEFAGKSEHFLMLKRDPTLRKGEKRIIGALLHILARMKFGTALTNDDLARVHDLTAKTLYAKAF